MKYIILFCLFLNGCFKSSEYIHLGDVIMVKSGFYTGCFGVTTKVNQYDTIPDEVILHSVTCPKGLVNYIIVEVDNL